jgi:hypothetical protein
MRYACACSTQANYGLRAAESLLRTGARSGQDAVSMLAQVLAG